MPPAPHRHQQGGPHDRPDHQERQAAYIRATGGDGYEIVVSWGEIDPAYAGKAVQVAWQEDGAALTDTSGPARLVVPGDKAGGRYAFHLIRLTAGNDD